MEYNARYKALSNWCKNAASSFGANKDLGDTVSLARGKQGTRLHEFWAQRRAKHRVRSRGDGNFARRMKHPLNHDLTCQASRFTLEEVSVLEHGSSTV